MSQPYFYIIGWRKLNTWYAGVRYAKNCCPSDLWVKYFTSSTRVKKFAEENGSPDYISTKIVGTAQETIDFELDFIRKILGKEGWLNRCAGSRYLVDAESIAKRTESRKGWKPAPLSADSKKKISETLKANHPRSWSGRKHSESSIALMKEKQKAAAQRRSEAGYKQSVERISQRVQKNTGKKRSPEQLERMKAAQQARRQKEQNGL